MKLCLECHLPFCLDNWKCPTCGFEPRACAEGFISFAQAETGVGFRPDFFKELTTLEAGHFWFNARNRLISHVFARHFPQTQSFLEIGCGTGQVLAELARRFPGMSLSGGEYFATGLPFSAARVPGATLYQMDARHIPFTDEFEVIGAFDVLEHIKEDDAALASITRAVRPGGGIILTVPQHRWLWSATDENACHERRYDHQDLLQKLKTAGLKVEYVTSFVSLLLPVMVLSRLLQTGIRGGGDLRDELSLNPTVNAFCSAMMGAEFTLIRNGIRFPVGGSLLVVAKKAGELGRDMK